jgi:FkbM family methyltransferase
MKDYRSDSGFLRTRAISKILINHPFNHAIECILEIGKNYLPEFKNKCIVPTIYDFNMIINPDKEILLNKNPLKGSVDNTMYYLGTYEAGTVSFIQSYLKKGSVFIDAGAYNGLMSLVASNVVGKKGKIISLEPLAENYKALISNVTLNEYKNIVPLNIAVGARSELTQIYSSCFSKSSASLLPPRKKQGTKPLDVKMKTIDQIVSEQKMKKLDMIKIDVEGSELEVIKGGYNTLKRNIPALIIEYSKNRTITKALFSYLEKLKLYDVFILRSGRHYVSELIPIKKYSQLTLMGGDVDNVSVVDNLFCIPKKKKFFYPVA